MRDRVSTKILGNGATRYGVYDEDGNLLRYEYIKLEDEPDEEGSLWNKANVLPDHIPVLLGLKMGNPQVKDALNVLANIGNVHVWSRTITLTDSTYKPVVGEDNYSVTLNPGDKLYYSDSVDIASLQDINLASPVSTFSFDGYSVPSVVGKYIRKNDGPTIYIYPASNQSIAGSTLWLRNCREISAAVDTPAGTHTDFVTSTNPDAYPNGEVDRQDAGYTLGAVETNKAISEATHSSNMGGTICKVASAVFVSEFGEVSLANPTNLTLAYSNTPFTSSLAGKFVMVTGYSAPVSGASHNCPVGLNTIFYIPSDATVVTSDYDADATYHFQIVASKFQTVTGYPATNAGEYTYLSQLGDKARIRVGSYVGTGVSHTTENNPFVLSFGFAPKIVFVYAEKDDNGNVTMAPPDMYYPNYVIIAYEYTTSYTNGLGLYAVSNSSYAPSANVRGKKSSDGMTFSMYYPNGRGEVNYKNTKFYYWALA